MEMKFIITRIPSQMQAGKPALGFEAPEHLGIRAADGDEAENFAGILLRKADVLDEDDADLVRADLVKLVHRAHDIAGLFRQAEHGIEAVENFAVVHADAEALQAELREYLINNGRNFRLVDDGELAVADDVDIGLIEFAEAAALGALAPRRYGHSSFGLWMNRHG